MLAFYKVTSLLRMSVYYAALCFIVLVFLKVGFWIYFFFWFFFFSVMPIHALILKLNLVISVEEWFFLRKKKGVSRFH